MKARAEAVAPEAFAFPLEPARQRLLAWYRAGNRRLPWRELWQKHADPYHVWVSEIMLQQTVIKAVLPAYARFLARFPTIESLAAGEEADVREAVRGLGYYRRFRMLHQAAKLVAGGPWPRDFESWKALPGIGDYTAAAISSIAFDFPAAVVDGNVERVFARLLDWRVAASEPGVKKVMQKLATALLAREAAGDFNQAVMELGQLVCTPTSPACEVCPLEGGCLAKARGSQALAPAPKKRVAPVEVAMRLTIVRDGAGQVGLWERPDSAKFLKGTWGFLTSLRLTDAFEPDGGVTTRDFAVEAAEAGSVKHTITKHRISAAIFRARLTKSSPPGAKWLAEGEVERHLVSNLDRKAWLTERRSPRRL